MEKEEQELFLNKINKHLLKIMNLKRGMEIFLYKKIKYFLNFFYEYSLWQSIMQSYKIVQAQSPVRKPK